MNAATPRPTAAALSGAIAIVTVALVLVTALATVGPIATAEWFAELPAREVNALVTAWDATATAVAHIGAWLATPTNELF